MSIKYNHVIIYGKQFESYRDAIEFLLDNGHINKEQAGESLDDGEPQGVELEWRIYNAYVETKGILGSTYSARTLYTEPDHVKKWNAYTDELLGDGCDIHEFVRYGEFS